MKSVVEQLDVIFKPSSIAVIGASETRGKWGYRMMSRILGAGFRGAVYPVNPSEKVIAGLPAYTSVLDIPGPVDMAVIVVPAAAVPQVMGECIQRGIRGAVVITAGFAEVGAEGKSLQERVVAIARQGGLRFVGPNGVGIFSSASNLNLSFDKAPLAGSIGFISQSGTFGVYLAEVAIAKGYGLSRFISIGNQADLNAADYLDYLAQDEDTKVIVLYMEGFTEGGRFLQVAREATRRKPVLIYKAGRTEAGARAAASHTGSLAGQGHVFQAACSQSGILPFEEVFHLFDVAEALAHQPLPRGRRVGILGSGGQGVVTSDACNLLGLEVPEFDAGAQIELKKALPPHAPTPRNPFDFAGGYRTALMEAQIVERIARLPYIDGIISRTPLRFTGGSAEELRNNIEACELICSIPERYRKPVFLLRWVVGSATILGEAGIELLRKAGIPIYDTPEQCARAMYSLARYAESRGY